MPYYHVKVEYSDSATRKRLQVYGFDYTELEEVKTEIVKAFLLHKPFLLDGTRIDENVRSLKVFKSEFSIDTCVRLVNQKTPPNIVIYFSRIDILPEEDYVVDITKEVIKDVQLIIDTEVSSGITNERVLVNPRGLSREVFLVHGHDDAARESVESFLRSLDLQPIVIFEQENKGQTIIEKIESHSDVPYAIALYTACDQGRAKEESDLKARARQNVVFEHGYLMGRLGRDRITALVKGDIETPGDLGGVVYIKMDASNAWRFKVAKELKAAGVDVDFSKIVM